MADLTLNKTTNVILIVRNLTLYKNMLFNKALLTLLIISIVKVNCFKQPKSY